jgi:hypothetical protein
MVILRVAAEHFNKEENRYFIIQNQDPAPELEAGATSRLN